MIILMVLSAISCKKEPTDTKFKITIVNGVTRQTEPDVEVTLRYIAQLSNRNEVVDYMKGSTDINGNVEFVLSKNHDAYYYSCVKNCMTGYGSVKIPEHNTRASMQSHDTIYNTGYLKLHKTTSDYYYYYIYYSGHKSRISTNGYWGVFPLSTGSYIFDCYADKSGYPDSVYSFSKTYNVTINPCDTITIDVP